MSTAANSYYFRRRTIGRAASPPTWACYEQIPYDDEYSDSGSDSCSEDEDDYSGGHGMHESTSDSEDKDHTVTSSGIPVDDPSHDLDMDIEQEGDGGANKAGEPQKDVKGKQRAIEHEPELSSRQQRRKRTPVYTLRPILTIQRSQGFVWNQDLFVPPYIKDRYVASTSPPNSKGFISTSASSTNSALTDYEVEVVEIRVKEGELDYIMP
ncbi:hypothetical protein D9615_005769 [Tricholomella constricta]|uniref:Uncharacterized protein n=1 Tax=Tricholomella constricta TaxID=117010 RepID=A0A8H5HAI9_9AGAR|nr:hypothetical protein D9615_005769 [Tricholomella constricta]